MNILIVTQYFWPESFRINELAAELARRGHRISVLTGVPNYPQGDVYPAYRADPAAFANHANCSVVRVPMLPRKTGRLRLALNYLSFALSASVLGPWKLRGQQFDQVFVYEPSPITVGLPGVLLARLKRAPLVFWVQDIWPDTLSAVGAVHSPLLLKLVGQLVRFIYRRCDLILAQSRSFIGPIRSYTLPQQRVEYFPNWVDPYVSAREPAPEMRALDQGAYFNIVFAGNIGEAQDFPAILAAACLAKFVQAEADIPPAAPSLDIAADGSGRKPTQRARLRWLIVGGGSMLNWVKQEIERLGLQHDVLLLGQHPPERMPEFFYAADALLVSLKDEPVFALTLPSKIQHYLSAGRPILAMLNGEGADLIRQGGAGISCPAGEPVELAAAAITLATLPAKMRWAMSIKGKALSAEEFDGRRLVDKLENWMRAS